MSYAKIYLYDFYGFYGYLVIFTSLITVNKMTQLVNIEALLTAYFVFTHFFNQRCSAHA